jgi:hypothetical protein
MPVPWVSWTPLPSNSRNWLGVSSTEDKFEEDCKPETFTTRSYADITMFGEVALELLKLPGLSRAVPGAIRAEDVPAALSRLTAAIDAKKFSRPAADKYAD